MKKAITTTAGIFSIMAIAACGADVDPHAQDSQSANPNPAETNADNSESVEDVDSADFDWELPEVDKESVAAGFEQMWDSEHWDSLDETQDSIEGWVSDKMENGGDINAEDFFGSDDNGDSEGSSEAEVEAPADNAMGEAYNREEHFNSGWTDVNGSGCDTREDILARDLNNVQMGDDGCTVESGVFLDSTGEVVEFEQGVNSHLVDIDHIVALDWAFENGADTWSQDMREQFAQDSANLWVMTADVNRGAKSSHGPSGWTPDGDMSCDYVKQFLDVADSYQLDVPQEDHAVEDAVC